MTAPHIPHGAWPSFMKAETAAGYLDESSVESFRRKVGRIYPKPIPVQGVGRRWCKADLDKWIAEAKAETQGVAVIDAADFI